MHSEFHKHLQAAFGTSGTSSPEWLLAGQQRAMQQIDNAGLDGKLKQLRQGFSSAAEKADEPLEVFIIGEGKFGKSTLINALLGENRAAVDWEPKTWCFNRYIATESPSSLVRLYVEQDLSQHSHLHSVLAYQKGRRRGLLECHIEPELADFILKGEENRLEEGRTTGRPYVSPIMEAQWEVGTAKALLPGLRLVDTHGFNQIHSDTSHLHYVKWQYERADAVLWLLTQERIGSAETDKELRLMSRYAKPIILVLNKWDLIRIDPDRQLERAQQLYAGRVSAIVPFSALQAFLSVEPVGYEYSDMDWKRLRKLKYSDWGELREPSGLDALVARFQSVVDLKNSRLRNMQTYSAARQKQREYRRMFNIHCHDLEQNIDIYLKIKAEVAAKKTMMLAQVAATFAELLPQSQKQFKGGLPELTYENRKHFRSILPLSQIEVHTGETQRRLARLLTEHLRGIVSFAHQENNQYQDSEFNPDGSVARRWLFENLGSLDIDVTKIPVKVNISLTQKEWLDQFADDVGDLFRSIFKAERHREIMRERGETVRREVEEQFNQAIRSYCQKAKLEINNMALTKIDMLRKDLDQHIDNLGGIDSARNKINEIEEVQKTVAIPPIFVANPVKVMKAMNWMVK